MHLCLLYIKSPSKNAIVSSGAEELHQIKMLSSSTTTVQPENLMLSWHLQPTRPACVLGFCFSLLRHPTNHTSRKWVVTKGKCLAPGMERSHRSSEKLSFIYSMDSHTFLGQGPLMEQKTFLRTPHKRNKNVTI